MFGIGLPELIIIIVVALLVVGPSKLPELARSMGRALGEFRRMADDVKDTIEQEMTKPLDLEDEKKTAQEKQAGQASPTEAPTEEKVAQTEWATGPEVAPEMYHSEPAEAAQAGTPTPDETYIAEEEKRLLDANREQVAKGTEVDEQKKT